MNVEAKNPKKLPKAAFSAFLELLLFNNSPINAPTNGPIMIPPAMGANNPTTKPIDVPIIPALVPPNRLVPMEGIT